MEKLYTPSTINYIKNKYGFQFSKSLGQNFLIDKNIIDKIIDGTDISNEDLIIEIGPGIGTLTVAAAEKAKKVIAIELDRKLIPILEEILNPNKNIEIVQGDILKVDLKKIIADAEEKYFISQGKKYKSIKIIGNLPYYITTPIIMHILENKIPINTITIMMQKEVANRLLSDENKKDYGAISLAVQYYAEVTSVADVPKEVFMPRPKVDSKVIKLTIRENPPVELKDEKLFFDIIKAGFGQRRKTLQNSLLGISSVEISKEDIKYLLENAGIEHSRRAETLSMNEFAKLANCLYISS